MATADGIKSAPSKVIGYFKKMEKGKKIRLGIFAALVVILIAVIAVVLNQKTYTVLYSGMEASDTGEVLTLLGEMGVDAKSQGEDTIVVADDDVDSIRLELASQGYPSSGVNDYSIYSNASGLGSTDSEKQIYYKYQLQANLRATIMQMDKIESAVVNLDLGEDSLFVLSDNQKPATASILLTLKNGQALSAGEVSAITELVAKSVSGLDPDNVCIVDSKTNLYTSGEEGGVQTADSQLTLQTSVQDSLQKQIISLLSPVFGEDNVLAQVSVTLNFDLTKKESVEYSTPEGTDGIVVSMKELVEAITNDADGSVAGIDANGNASQYLETLGESDNAVYYNISREVNNEVNQTTTQIEKAQGQIEDLSVSVILNSASVDDYQKEVKDLISTAIGASPDKITVKMLPFDAAEAVQEEDAAAAEAAVAYQQELASATQGAETTRLVIIVIAALIAVIFLFSIIKMFISGKAEAAGGIDVMVGDVPEGPAARTGYSRRSPKPVPPLEEEEIEIKGKDSKMTVLEDYIGKNPESAANLLRNWLNEE